jgi:hypothetical protein
MIFRFTLNNTIEGSQVISEPIGWEDITVKLMRHEDYASLVEMIDLPIMFYGANSTQDGGYDYIRNVVDTQGINAIIEITIEAHEEGEVFENFFVGTLDLSTLKDISDAKSYKLECAIVRNSFWTKFINRKEIPVDLEDTVDLDGDAITPLDHFSLPLPSQKIRIDYNGFLENVYSFNEDDGITSANFVQIDMDNEPISEIHKKFNLPIVINTSIPVNIFEIELEGYYQIDIQVTCSIVHFLLIAPMWN